MKTYQNIARKDWPALLQRPVLKQAAIQETVNNIFEETARNGDETLYRYTRFFDRVSLKSLQPDASEWALAETETSENLKLAMQQAAANIRAFHEIQTSKENMLETTSGVLCWQNSKAIKRVGLYVPGGSAPLFSSVLMLGIPAQLAGCKEIVLCTPPQKNGNIAPAVLYAAKLAGIKEVYKLGGIQAIAAMSVGTESIAPVMKILGPGNQYVTAAKLKALDYGVAMDMPAGPSELLVIADDTAEVDFVASDLLSQAEHGADSQVLLLTTDAAILTKVQLAIEIQLANLPRQNIARAALKNARFIAFEEKEALIDFANAYAPEHLIIVSQDESFYLDNLENAGSVFLGNYSPESAGDYASGTNHTLPTNGAAKAYGGIGLSSFTKTISYQRISADGLKNIGPCIETMAAAEQLEGHKNAVSLRLKALENENI